MAIQYNFQKRIHGISLNSGDIIKFAYTGYEEDPTPLCIFLYSTSGYHPRTRHEHHYLQGINLNYVSRHNRKQFVRDWIERHNKTQNTRLTYNYMKSLYPYMDSITRRYFWKPSYYLRKLEKISLDKIESEVVGSLYKDYSQALRRQYFSGIRKLQRIF
jgi:hypothetical protein